MLLPRLIHIESNYYSQVEIVNDREKDIRLYPRFKTILIFTIKFPHVVLNSSGHPIKLRFNIHVNSNHSDVSYKVNSKGRKDL